MRVDFYQLSRDPVTAVVPLLARKVVESGARLLVVDRDADRRAALSDSLWAAEGTFLAHGEDSEPHADRQPILLSDGFASTNGATMAVIADGQWDEAARNFDRVLLLFDADARDQARELWRNLSGNADYTLHIFKQNSDGNWTEGA